MNGKILYHASEVVTPEGKQLRRGKEMSQISRIPDGAVVIAGEKIEDVGTTEEIFIKYKIPQRPPEQKDGWEMINLSGKVILPGFVDSHTHFIFGGYRPEEFMLRLAGAGYMDIMRMGGGIQSTVDSTREEPAEMLYESGRKRLADMLSMGVTTVEGKSGYGLDLECELKQLRVMKALNEEQPVEIAATYLGAHAVPPEYAGREEAYLDYMIEHVLPVVKEASLARFCDVFCEDGVFSVGQSERLLKAAANLGFGLKIHADEIVSLGGGELAARLSAVSADHLLAVSDEGIRLLADSGTAATLLPCTAFCLNKPYAPARKMIDGGCGVALASDYNPGSCFTNSVPLILALAVITMGMTMEEAICALTLNGAAAVGRADVIGTVAPGKQADLVILGCPDYRFLVYHTGKNLVETVIKRGEIVYGK